MSGHCPTGGPNYKRSYSCVLRHWDPEKLIVHYTTFSIKSWMPVSSTGMTPFAVFNKNKCSYSCVADTGMTTF
ncbi:WPE palindromic element domain-containing protein [Wolbachia endosymbiont (group A) of Tiphia femorata]|uniref:WPE palindromic element domain-containing protein n=1 Tax=Wolbachia endosymbiont (group A) of Tiphia femorata TaxID=2954063 RepID=UPI002231A2AA|nr:MULTISPECIES: WPE palindromic element domain-containing protein [unclassified Wolbachia]